ncbi:MFS transporter [Galactobacter caseinivorans]|uniref:MFS transporter n=1 Tax=Galactobacter caseinivorans TaxID=2676123 RepID=UPI00131497D5|nr:MFS transporter [Galactobacter caseinivorans]
MAAFEALAVATIMPVVAKDLDGHHLYAIALAAPLATGIVGMVGAGGWADRRGPKGPFWVGGILFALGLVVCGLSLDMYTFTGGRILQGLGAGAINVTIYVLVARLYPPHLHARIFGLFAAGWVLPSLIGPFLAGAVATLWSWHWVFLGVVVLVALAAFVMIPSLRRLPAQEPLTEESRASMRPLGPDLVRAVLIASAVLVIGFVGKTPGWGVPILIILVAAVLTLIYPLLPQGAFRLKVGLPGAVVLRGMIAAAFFGAEAFLPLLLNEVYGLDIALSGLALTAAALTWALASWIQGRFLERWPDRSLLMMAVSIVFFSLAGVAVSTGLLWPVWALVAFWGVGGLGMGLAYPRLSTMVIRLSEPSRQGFNSAALNMADSTGAAMGLAALGMLQRGSELGPLVLILSLSAALGGLAVLASRRTGPLHTPGPTALGGV